MKATTVILAAMLLAGGIGMIATLPETVSALPSANEFRVNSDAELAAEADSGAGTLGDPWVIENRVIDGAGLNYAMYIANTTEYLTIRNCTVNHTTEAHSFPYAVSAGIHIYNCSEVTITTSRVYDAKTYGIFVSNNSYNIQIDNCTLWNNTDRGISYSDTDNSRLTDTYIYCNDTTINGVVLDLLSDNHLIVGNYIEHALWCGVVMNDTWNATLYDNEIVGNITDMGPDGNVSTYHGIGIYNSWYIDVNNNTITDCMSGITIRGSDEAGIGPFTRESDFSYNNISGCYNAGIYINYADEILITQNEIENTNGYLGAGLWDTGIMVEENVTYANFTYNTVSDYTTGINVTTDTGVASCYAHNNVFATNTLHAYAETTDALFQFWDEVADEGNWWDDWTYVHGGDTDRDGIVDTPRDIPGTGAAIDSYPQTTVPALPVTPGGGGTSSTTPDPTLDTTTTPTDAGWDISFGWMFWAGGVLILLGFARFPIPYVQPLWLKVGGAFLIVLNFLM